MTTHAAPAVDPDYLESAREHGLLHTHDGLPYVLGAFTDPATGERQCLVEYCDSALLTGDPRLGWLVAHTAAEHADADLLVLRAPGELTLPAPWVRHQTYIRPTDAAVDLAPAPGGIEVAQAGPEADDLVRGWLAWAIADAATDRGRSTDPRVLDELAGEVLAHPGRRSYLALAGGLPIGHLTLCPDQLDEVTGRRHVELCDVLVEPPELRGPAQTALLAAATAFARSTGDPLLGQVQHPEETAAPGYRPSVLTTLLDRGWTIDHTFWRRRP
ncbi:hypothetical protein ACFVUY_27305 [Kitasatospora sp. NPDC058063]|uniref:hypothetical protein n=1 Tax=unclassified Kitasatospora TaxID=2633591 RepID=UPI0036DEFCDE